MNESSGRKVGIARFFELLGLFLGGWTSVLFNMVNEGNPSTPMWAAAITAVYWVVVLLTLPASIIVILAFGFWLPVVPALMIIYPGLDKVFRLEETLKARRDAEINERLAAREAENHDL